MSNLKKNITFAATLKTVVIIVCLKGLKLDYKTY